LKDKRILHCLQAPTNQNKTKKLYLLKGEYNNKPIKYHGTSDDKSTSTSTSSHPNSQGAGLLSEPTAHLSTAAVAIFI